MRVLVATAIYPKPDRPELGAFVRTQVDSLRLAGIDIDLFVLDGPNRKLMYLAAVPEIRRRLGTARYDLIHAHYSYVGAVARAATLRHARPRTPVVLTYHGTDLLGWIDARGRKTQSSKLVAIGSAALADWVDGVIVQSEQMARRLHREDVYVIPHEVDLSVFRPMHPLEARVALGLDRAKPYVLFAAPPAKTIKNFPMAEAAVQRLRRDGINCELIVAAHETQERLALLMNACDVLAFPSWQEGSPNVVKQAMACNMPIVAADVGDVRTLITGVEGCHLAVHREDDFAAYLRLELERRRRTTGRDAVAHLSCERVAGRVIRAYEQTLEVHARS